MSYLDLRQTVFTNQDGAVLISGWFSYRFFGALSLPERFTLSGLDETSIVGRKDRIHSKELLLW